MRVLLVSHTYLAAINWAKPRALAQHVALTVLAPRRWRDALFTLTATPPVPSFLRLLPTFADGAALRHGYRPAAIIQLLHEARPTLVHVEEEPPSLALAQFAALQPFFGYALTCFTWENWRMPHGPARWVEHFNLARCAGVIAGNADAARLLLERGFTRPVAVIPQLGVDPSEFSPTSLPSARPFTIGFFGRLVPEKGVRVLLDAIRGLPKMLLQIIGNGPLQAEIEVQIAQPDLMAHVQLSPAIPHAAIPARLREIDTLVLPSLTTPYWKEQFGHILIEAMACGVPVIGSDSGAIPEVIGEAGLIFPAGNAEALRAALIQLRDSTERREQLAQAGRARVLAHYTHEQIARDTVRFFQQVGQ